MGWPRDCSLSLSFVTVTTEFGRDVDELEAAGVDGSLSLSAVLTVCGCVVVRVGLGKLEVSNRDGEFTTVRRLKTPPFISENHLNCTKNVLIYQVIIRFNANAALPQCFYGVFVLLKLLYFFATLLEISMISFFT